MELKPTKMAVPKGPTNDNASKDLPRASEVMQFHLSSDLDSGPRAQHHTLGPRRNQSAPGDHIHDGRESRKIAAGMGEVLSGSKGGNVALTNLINMLKKYVEFTDSTT